MNFFSSARPLKKFFSSAMPLKISFFPAEGPSKFFSWRVPLKIYFFLEKGLRNYFFIDFLWPHPQIINGRPLKHDRSITLCHSLCIVGWPAVRERYKEVYRSFWGVFLFYTQLGLYTCTVNQLNLAAGNFSFLVKFE